MGGGHRYAKITPDVRKRIVYLATEENLPALIIAERMGISYFSVYKVFREEKVQFKRRLHGF